MNLAVIPARGGSKRIPRKNIKYFCGKPIIAWSIEIARQSGCFDIILVSTDDPEIRDVASNYGADTPFLRPAEISDDYTGTSQVVSHAINWFKSHNIHPDLVCCIYATAPFIRVDDLLRGLDALRNTHWSYSFSVTSYAFPIQRAIRIEPSGGVRMFNPDYIATRSQDLEEAFHDAGQFYWGRTDAWLDSKNLFSHHSVPIILPRYRVQDIDTMEDWQHAELLFKSLQEK